ncbi:hypothetical protein NKH52_20775 [Mesorhizobium sp. M1066]|uniref:hypothetical protein n=1 Tax=unclassified Mesorhizobium TaxID=325217 RepID=UPI00333B34E9
MLFEFAAINGGPVTFRTIGGATPLKAFAGGSWLAWDAEVAQFTEGGYFRNGFPVLRHVVALTAEWVQREKPYSFHFEATDDRKHRIYEYLVARYGRSIAHRYTSYRDGCLFCFVRRSNP